MKLSVLDEDEKNDDFVQEKQERYNEICRSAGLDSGLARVKDVTDQELQHAIDAAREEVHQFELKSSLFNGINKRDNFIRKSMISHAERQFSRLIDAIENEIKRRKVVNNSTNENQMRLWMHRVSKLFENISKYPMASRDDWYGDADYRSRGGRLVQMSPKDYLSQVRPLKMDDISRENIDDLKKHILDGHKLDPLIIYADGKEDGRHRAYAAKELGIALVPVIDFRKSI